MLHSFGVKGDSDAKTLDDSKRVQVKGEYISTLFYILLIFYYDIILAKKVSRTRKTCHGITVEQGKNTE